MEPMRTAQPGNYTVFHGTSKRFEHFSLEFAARPGMSGNGHLGVWLAVERELAARFGCITLTVGLDVQRAYLMSISELAKLNQVVQRMTRELNSHEAAEEVEREFYTEHRNRLIAEGYDTIFLQEGNGQVAMVIGLIPSHLTVQ